MKVVLWVWPSMSVCCYLITEYGVADKNQRNKKCQRARLQLSLSILLLYEGGNWVILSSLLEFQEQYSMLSQSVAQQAGLSVPAVYWNKWSLHVHSIFKVIYCDDGQLYSPKHTASLFLQKSHYSLDVLVIRCWLAAFKHGAFTHWSHILPGHPGGEKLLLLLLLRLTFKTQAWYQQPVQ